MLVTKSNNSLHCEFVVKAPVEKVWAALTTKEGWECWFSSKVESDFAVGSKIEMFFGSFGPVEGLVAERVEHSVFAYKWHPGEDGATGTHPPEEMTTVRFELAPQAEGTLIKMTESGFDLVNTNRRGGAFADNEGGWTEELEELNVWLNDGIKQKAPKSE